MSNVELPIAEPVMSAHRQRFSLERGLTLFAFFGALPAVVVSMVLIWRGEYTPKVQWTLSLLIVGFWLGFVLASRERIVYSLRTLSNLLAALREGDFSLRAGSTRSGALGEVMQEVNMMGEILREQRLSAVEATHLLRKVMEEIDVAVFAFDDTRHLRLVNRAGEKLLGRSAEELVGREVGEIRLADCLDDEAPHTLQKSFPGGSGRWGISHTDFREHGRRHRLLVLTDLTVQLREEELQAWQRLVRVLGHELNNSLAPIKSISGSIRTLLEHPQPPPDWKQVVRQGLAAIGSRADALSRFTGAYARLAKMPEPRLAPVDVPAWIRRVVQLETRLQVEIEPGPEITIDGDADQLEQMLINLVRNAVDAALETGGGVRAGWRKNHTQLEVWIRDEGPGISSDANLFVPFFTTKPGGSGIGLVLSRKIAENHRGTLTLTNRAGARGCETKLRIPLGESGVRG